MNAAAALLGELGGTVVSIDDKMKLASLWMQWAAMAEHQQRSVEMFFDKMAFINQQHEAQRQKSQEESND